ncbi:MAG: inositol monophosphatase [Anaerolineae bacterium]|nr:inositol monophosphatase [Anaerolineae bacterium]
MAPSPFEFRKIQTWLREAGHIALGYYQTGLTRQQKADNSPVSEADRAVEQFLIGKIRQTYARPEHTIIGEEFGGNWQDSEFVWAIDPIDGTRVFLDGLPLWGISLGLLRNGKAYRGIVYLPVINEIYYTDDEGIAFWNDRPLKGMLRTDWNSDSFIAVPSEVQHLFNINFWRLRAFGSAVAHQVYVARGAAVAALQTKLSLWDIAGPNAILSRIGGVATYLDGSPVLMPDVLAQGKCRGTVLIGHPLVVEKLLPQIEARPLATNTVIVKD